ncbi:hypothetical protein FRB95_005151 [Tulasnella sp. JGI-2019a]|nr:hypothetical protein FRB95_005151 [Tulasnella sp. JGI-2019a]
MLLFRLLFPQEDHRRRYDLKEARLATVLCEALQFAPAAISQLKAWATAQGTNPAVGCLGGVVRGVLRTRPPIESGADISLERIDELLDELAQHSSFSNLELELTRAQPRSRPTIVRELYTSLTPFGAACMTQIILKDLRPLLYPVAPTRSTINLMHFKSNAIHELTHYEAMSVWDCGMPRIYKNRSSLDVAAGVVDDLSHGTIVVDPFVPTLGTPIEIPKCVKGQDCQSILNIMRGPGGSPVLWAETKYDGERMQIHVDLSLPTAPAIQIFSKSKRDSTMDRIACHPIILGALGLETRHGKDAKLASRVAATIGPPRRINTSVILEAEMVCYNEANDCIDEFWRIRSLVEATAQGGRARFNGNRFQAPPSPGTLGGCMHESLRSTGEDGGNRHFMLVFFDVLLLDGRTLTAESYESRRALLEQLITPLPGYAILAKREKLLIDGPDALVQLTQVFARHIADYEEGLVLKPGSSAYNDMKPALRWVKLKKDYIKGLGDTLDLAVFGASWAKDRGRELRVGPETYTTFFIGAMDRSLEKKRKARGKVHIKILFAASYGLSREQLDGFNWEIKQSRTYPNHPMKLADLSYTLDFAKGMPERPTIIFSQPRLVELMGAGFTKSAGSDYYGLRFPRITKVWRQSERTWLDGVDLEEFHKIACDSIGRDAPKKQTADAIKKIWALPVSPGIRTASRRSSRISSWLQKLDAVDEPVENRCRGEKRQTTEESHSPSKRCRLTDTGPPLHPSTNIPRTHQLASCSSPTRLKTSHGEPSSPRRGRSNIVNSPPMTLCRRSPTRLRISAQSPTRRSGQTSRYLIYPSPPRTSPPQCTVEHFLGNTPGSIPAVPVDKDLQQVAASVNESSAWHSLDHIALLPPINLGSEEAGFRTGREIHKYKTKKLMTRNKRIRNTGCPFPTLPQLLALAMAGGMRDSGFSKDPLFNEGDIVGSPGTRT